eukprot:6479367-Lingulodinium_polyedra.AAC.1
MRVGLRVADVVGHALRRRCQVGRDQCRHRGRRRFRVGLRVADVVAVQRVGAAALAEVAGVRAAGQ